MSAQAGGRSPAQLERRIAELCATVEELEGLTRTITHDVRAPLRAIEGYARLLEEEEGARLSGEGRRYLGEVGAGARRLTRLVDGLAAYARIGRADMRRQPVDMYRLACEVADELEGSGQAGRVRIDVAPLAGAHGDPELLRRVWSELLGNAVKFSAKAESPVVRVALKKGGRGPIYSVEDNGAGFDMKYAGKLFGVFQRLHHPADFDGVGVGLAIARRIVERHDGCIRAEVRPGGGAVFSFELPAQGRPGEESREVPA